MTRLTTGQGHSEEQRSCDNMAERKSRYRLSCMLSFYSTSNRYWRPIFNMYRNPHQRPIQRQSVPEGMTSDLTERVSIISSAKVIPHDDITFKSPRLVGGYNWIEPGDEEDQPTIAVPGTSINLNDG